MEYEYIPSSTIPTTIPECDYTIWLNEMFIEHKNSCLPSLEIGDDRRQYIKECNGRIRFARTMRKYLMSQNTDESGQTKLFH